jgi:hypothetical protein
MVGGIRPSEKRRSHPLFKFDSSQFRYNEAEQLILGEQAMAQVRGLIDHL